MVPTMAMIIVFPAPDKNGGAVLLEQILDPAPEGFRKHIFLSYLSRLYLQRPSAKYPAK